ncbi:hypothetical protein CL632_00325 [bacterium]|nr:hypothetical protein [bacterium]MDP6571784.1 hypothetical protein [Patescibacteria group bacterium]MDP6756497.1 hypothetical protein [Patescibacteria group bacterium]|tara:strand:+ start:1736 stop:3010 length:1275 start_codon:yes stop_codon:yes gene_type:complete
MPAAKEHNINLLPNELRKSKKSSKSDDHSSVEYTLGNDKDKKGSNQKKDPKKKSFFSKISSIFRSSSKSSKKDKAEHKDDKSALPKKSSHKDLPQGKPLPSALFSKNSAKDNVSKPNHVLPVQKNSHPPVSARSVMSMHSPNFISASSKKKNISIQQVREQKKAPDKKKPKKSAQGGSVSSGAPFWKRWFFKEKKQPALPAKIPKEQKPQEKNTTASAVAGFAKSGQTQAPVHRTSSFDVNLLTAEYTRDFQQGNPMAALGAWAGGAILIIGLAFGSLYIYESRSQLNVDEEKKIVAALNQTISTYSSLEGEDVELRKKVNSASELLEDHISWSSFLKQLEGETIPEVTYINIAASTKGLMNISALAVDYTALARQITVYQKTAWVVDISITSASFVEETVTSPEGVVFDIQLEIDTDILALSQ